MILVTGATGFVGRSLMAALERANLEAKMYTGRMNDPLKLREELVGVTTVIHLATSTSRGQDRLLRHVDQDGTARLLEECQRANIAHLIYTSHINADPLSWHALLQIKGQIERSIQASGVPSTILRSATLYGRNDHFTEMLVSLAIWSWPFVWLPGSGKSSWQPLWVEDFVRCILLTINQPQYIGQTITVAGDERLRYRDLMARLLHAAGYKRLAVPLPMTLLRPLNNLLFRWWYRPPFTRYFLDRFFVPEVTDYDTVMRHFGFQPHRLNNQIVYLRRSGLWRRLFTR
jgi:NADH dehydrogenase